MNILHFVRESFNNLLSATTSNRSIHRDIPVGTGYYAQRITVSASGNTYSKLVVKDQSNTLMFRNKLKPQTGMRHPEKRTGRRQNKAFKQTIEKGR